DGFFDDPNNWDVVGSSPVVHAVPGAGDIAVANVASNITITVRDARVVDSLNISERIHIVSGGSLTVGVGSSNSISQLTLDNGGTLDVTGLSTVLTPGDGSVYAGAVNVDAGAKLTFGGTVVAVGNNVNAGASFTGQGHFEIDGLAIVNFNTSLT